MYIGSEVRLWSKTTPSLVAYRIEGKQKRLAVDRDLSDPAVERWQGDPGQGEAGMGAPGNVQQRQELRQWLERAIYGGQSPWLLLRAATWKVGACVLVVGLALAIPARPPAAADAEVWAQDERPGSWRRRRGSIAPIRSNGIGFLTKERRTLIEFLLQREGKMVQRAARAGKARTS